MPELGPYGSVRGARGNSRPYRESRRGPTKPPRLCENAALDVIRAIRFPHDLGGLDEALH